MSGNGQKPMVGNNVSHANNETKRRFLPNLHKKRFFLIEENRWIRITVSARGIKTINKNGIAAIVHKMRANGEKSDGKIQNAPESVVNKKVL